MNINNLHMSSVSSKQQDAYCCLRALSCVVAGEFSGADSRVGSVAGTVQSSTALKNKSLQCCHLR
jgi:hypothetical protein